MVREDEKNFPCARQLVRPCCALNRKRWRATAVQDAGAFSNGLRTSRNVLDCASPLALFLRESAGGTGKAARCRPRRTEVKAELTPPNFPRKLRAWRKRPLLKTVGLTCRSARTRGSASRLARQPLRQGHARPDFRKL